MSLLNAHRSREHTRIVSILPDFTGYGLTRLFALFKPPQATINYPMKIRDVAGSRDLYVFFDGNNEISLDSPLSLTTSPTTELLGDLVIGSINIEVISLFCLISAKQLNKTTFGAYIVYNGSLVVRKSKAALYIPKDIVGGFVGSAITEFNGSFSTLARHTPIFGGFWNSLISASTGTWTTYRHWRPTVIGASFVFFRGGSTSYEVSTTSSQTNNIPYNTIGSVNKNVEIKGFENGVLIGTTPISGNLANNTNFMVLKRYSETQGLTGYCQFLGVSTSILTLTDSQNFKTLMDNYFI